jgi:hypothetical protein
MTACEEVIVQKQFITGIKSLITLLQKHLNMTQSFVF